MAIVHKLVAHHERFYDSEYLERWDAVVKQVYQFPKFLPVEEKYGLRSQICYSAVSIPSHIADGCSRSSQIDFKRFLEKDLGSSFELETQLIIIEELSIISNGDISVV